MVQYLMFIIDLIILLHRQFVDTLVAAVGYVENARTRMSMQDMVSVLYMIDLKNMEKAGLPDSEIGLTVLFQFVHWFEWDWLNRKTMRRRARLCTPRRLP